MATQSKTTSLLDNILLTDQPDGYVDLDDSRGCMISSAGQYADERLQFYAEHIAPYWFEHQCSLHQLSAYVAQFGITLHLCPDDSQDRLPSGFVAFWMRFSAQYPGDVLFQCKLKNQNRIH